MSERREITLAILNERKEWLTERQLVLDRQFSMQERTITEIAGTKVEIASFKAEDHAVRNVLQQLTSKIDAMSLHIQALGKGGTS